MRADTPSPPSTSLTRVARRGAGFTHQDDVQLGDACLHTGRLFVDSASFPPSRRSLGDLPDLSSWRQAQVERRRPQGTLTRCSCSYLQI